MILSYYNGSYGDDTVDIVIIAVHLCVVAPRAQEVMALKSDKHPCVTLALIASMPKVFEAVQDKCITKANCKKDSKLFYVSYICTVSQQSGYMHIKNYSHLIVNTLKCRKYTESYFKGVKIVRPSYHQPLSQNLRCHLLRKLNVDL
jgi:hypothetical protein